MFNLSSGVNSFEDLYDIHDYGNFVGSQGDDIILGGASHSVGIVRWLETMMLFMEIQLDSLRYDLEEELATEEIIGSTINKINDHVEINLGDDSLTIK